MHRIKKKRDLKNSDFPAYQQLNAITALVNEFHPQASQDLAF